MYLALLAIATLWAVLAVVALYRIRRRTHLARTAPPVSVLKPLCGLDPSLERNLSSFFEQDHPNFELVFGVEGDDDPAIDLVRKLRERYPNVPTRLVVHRGQAGLNPKVRNLLAMQPEATHDIVLISDSNVWVPPHHLREMSSHMNASTGMVTSLIVGVSADGRSSLGATLEQLHLAGAVAGGIALANEAGHAAVMGKSMMFRSSVVQAMGGLESVAFVLAEDYVLGQMIEAAGLKVIVNATPVQNVVGSQSVRRFFERNVRWSMMRLRLAPWAYALEPLTSPLLVALAAPLFGVGMREPLMWALTLTLTRDALQWTLLRGTRGLVRSLPLAPLRDIVIALVWLVAPFKKHVSWRGTRVRVASGTRLFVESAVSCEDDARIVEV